MAHANTMANTTYPAWLPPDFQVKSGNTSYPSAGRGLASLALYNCIAIGTFLLTGNSHIRGFFTKGRKANFKPWSFWSSLSSLAFQILGNVATALLIRASGYHVHLWQLVQLWALRPRVTWLIGNMANVTLKWGYANGALSHIFVEVFVCALSCVFLGRTINAAITNSDFNGSRTYWCMILIASLIMLLSTGLEMLWAVWMIKRIVELRGRPEAQDIDSLKWIARSFVPVTAICSWLIWIAFLKAAEGRYCPGNIKWVDVVWALVPILANICRLAIGSISS